MAAGECAAHWRRGLRRSLPQEAARNTLLLQYLVLSSVSAFVPLQRELTRVAELDDVARR